MSKAFIYLARHGQIRSNLQKIYAGWSDEPLTEEGVSDAYKTGGVIRQWNITHVFTSPIKRAVQTASILNESINVSLSVIDNLKEMKMGPWEGLSEDEIKMKYPEEWATWMKNSPDLKLSGRETLGELQQRAVSAIKEIENIAPGAISIAVTHVALIRCLYLYFNNQPLDDYKSIEVPNLSVFRITVDGAEYFMKRFI